jgi:uncharacterized membrane protein YczE
VSAASHIPAWLRRSFRLFLHRLLLTWAFTRDGALIAARSMQARRALSPARKVTLILVGSALLGFGIACFLHAQLGLPPTDVLISAVSDRTGLSHGPASWLVGGILFGAAAALGRRPSIYGLLFVAANGLSIGAWTQLLVQPSGLLARIFFVVVGVAAVAAGVALVADSSSTGGPSELLTRAASDRHWNPTVARSVLEGSVIVAGIALGGELGIATVAFALTIGPAISFTVQALADQRAGREQRQEDDRLTSRIESSRLRI